MHLSCAAGVVLALSLTACGSSGTSAAPQPTATVTVTASAIPSPSDAAAEDAATFSPVYGDVAAYVNKHLPKGFPGAGYYKDDSQKVDDFYGQLCDAVNGTQPDGTVRQNAINGAASAFDGKNKGNTKLGAEFVDTVFDACWQTGLANPHWVFNAGDYKVDRDVLTILHSSGFDDYIERGSNPGTTVQSTCDMIDREQDGGEYHRSERAEWMKALSGTGSDQFGWTTDKAKRFIDTLFDACFSTGHSRPYVPPVPTIDEGVWTVGTDIPPGTYRSNGDLSDCYWMISRSGSNGEDIIANDLPSGGHPTVTLSQGQDFDTEGCGTWRKIG